MATIRKLEEEFLLNKKGELCDGGQPPKTESPRACAESAVLAAAGLVVASVQSWSAQTLTVQGEGR